VTNVQFTKICLTQIIKLHRLLILYEITIDNNYVLLNIQIFDYCESIGYLKKMRHHKIIKYFKRKNVFSFKFYFY